METKHTPDAPAPLPCSINMRVIPRLQARKIIPLYGQRPSDLECRASFHVPHKNKRCPAWENCHIVTISHRDCIPHVPRMLQQHTIATDFHLKGCFHRCIIGWSPIHIQEGAIDWITICGPFPLQGNELFSHSPIQEQASEILRHLLRSDTFYWYNKHLRDDFNLH
jgi:hypothetical protein